MATTSLWHIKGRLGDLIDYVENPEKTVPKGTEDFFNVFEYVRREDKTREEYVSTINCAKPIALQQMILTKKQYGKNDNYIAWHGYQSFKVGEVEPQLAHEIGVKLAKEMWGDRFQIVVTTHLDKDHIHNHFAFNSVSFRDGGKYNYSKKEQQRLRDTSDRLCQEYGLSIITRPHKAPSRPVWLDEKSGKPTRYNVYRKDIREAFENSVNVSDAEQYLQRLGYITDFSGKHWKIRLPQYQHFTRLDTLDEQWTPTYWEQHVGTRAYYGSKEAKVDYTPYMPRGYYKCSNYKSNRGQCQVHYIRELSLQKIVLKAIQDLAVFAQEFEPVFLYLMDQKSNKEQKQEIARLDQVIRNSKKRIEEIDRIISRLYEDNISGKISDERYFKMAEGYESEQKALSEQTSADEKKLAEMKQKTNDLRLLLQTLRKCTDITGLNRELVNRLIQRIEVHNNNKYDGHCHVKVDIYFTGVGIIDIPTEQEILKLMENIRNSKTIEQSA